MLQLFKGVCLAVREMHHSSPPLAHRDLKLGNVLLAEHDAPVLMDFGSADKVFFLKKKRKKRKKERKNE